MSRVFSRQPLGILVLLKETRNPRELMAKGALGLFIKDQMLWPALPSRAERRETERLGKQGARRHYLTDASRSSRTGSSTPGLHSQRRAEVVYPRPCDMPRIVRSALTLFEVGEQTTRSPCLLAAHSLALFLPRWQWKYPVVSGDYEKNFSQI